MCDLYSPFDGSVKFNPPFRDYEITPAGEIYSHKRNKYIKAIIDRNGYVIVRLHDGRGMRQSKAVARLVAETYLPHKGPNKNTVLYKDYDRTNVHMDNLRWVTRTYSLRYDSQIEEREHFNDPRHKVRVSTHGIDRLPQPVGTIAEAAEKYGLLYREVWQSAQEERPCATDMRYTFSAEYPIEFL